MVTVLLSEDPACEIVSTRIFTTSRKNLFQAFSNPLHLQNWWGPQGFTNTFHEFDFRAGGQWRFTMHGPDKGNYENHCEFVEIEEPEIIAWKRYSNHYFICCCYSNLYPNSKPN